MNQRRLLAGAVLLLCAVTLAHAQYSPRKDYVWARDISVAASPTITLDGVLTEAVWAKATPPPHQASAPASTSVDKW